MALLTDEEIQKYLLSLNGWTVHEEQLQKEFKFRDFSEALAFMVQVGIISEKMNHHPEMNNVYNRVILKISTHSERGITMKDIDWVEAINSLS